MNLTALSIIKIVKMMMVMLAMISGKAKHHRRCKKCIFTKSFFIFICLMLTELLMLFLLLGNQADTRREWMLVNYRIMNLLNIQYWKLIDRLVNNRVYQKNQHNLNNQTTEKHGKERNRHNKHKNKAWVGNHNNKQKKMAMLMLMVMRMRRNMVLKRMLLKKNKNNLSKKKRILLRSSNSNRRNSSKKV